MMGKTSTRDIIDGLSPMDDTFMQKLAEHIGFCEELLQTILEMPGLHVIKVTPQCSLHNIDSRSVTVDILCEDSEGKQFSIEVQKSDNDNHQKRVRYNGACIQTIKFQKNTAFEQLFDLYMVYISAFDMFGKGKTIYHINRVIEETGDIVDNGYHEVYVNTQIDDGSDIAELMGILKSTEVPVNPKFPKTCEVISYYKKGKGQFDMSTLVEDYAKDYAEEVSFEKMKNSAVRMIKRGFSDEDISEMLELSLDVVISLRRELSSEE